MQWSSLRIRSTTRSLTCDPKDAEHMPGMLCTASSGFGISLRQHMARTLRWLHLCTANVCMCHAAGGPDAWKQQDMSAWARGCKGAPRNARVRCAHAPLAPRPIRGMCLMPLWTRTTCCERAPLCGGHAAARLPPAARAAGPPAAPGPAGHVIYTKRGLALRFPGMCRMNSARSRRWSEQLRTARHTCFTVELHEGSYGTNSCVV